MNRKRARLLDLAEDSGVKKQIHEGSKIVQKLSQFAQKNVAKIKS
jgi:hypothetical protein